MEKADIQKSLIIFNCFVLSWSEVGAAWLVHGRCRYPPPLHAARGPRAEVGSARAQACPRSRACWCQTSWKGAGFYEGTAEEADRLAFPSSEKENWKKKIKKEERQREREAKGRATAPSRRPGRLWVLASALVPLCGPLSLQGHDVGGASYGQPHADG